MRKGLLKKLAQLSRLRNPTPGYLQAGEPEKLAAWLSPSVKASQPGHSNGTLAKCCSLDLGLPGLCNANAAYATHRFYPADMDCVVGRTLTGSRRDGDFTSTVRKASPHSCSGPAVREGEDQREGCFQGERPGRAQSFAFAVQHRACVGGRVGHRLSSLQALTFIKKTNNTHRFPFSEARS
ncbi:PREDICTED: uncharacterized protein LOC105597516 isoform X2 [Cercocebus atys]|uniref:uncharacterized protein LOC105597516 isoform X2 n=1 Tax=Cercocebus atys TaxID=9531 RepID=UPI0005F494BB|nr:PREDICTED: uncharacterized protein LOC105597516 isoform X2 [Cercocebus atys]